MLPLPPRCIQHYLGTRIPCITAFSAANFHTRLYQSDLVPSCNVCFAAASLAAQRKAGTLEDELAWYFSSCFYHLVSS